MNEKTNRITVYTTTYNRAYILTKAYESLCRQTCDDFEWLIVDDGSTDNTATLVQKWINEGEINIRYIFQENQGVNIARNKAIENISSELNVCLDSDDFFKDEAIEKILTTWDGRKSDIYVGVIGLDCYPSEVIVGKPFPKELTEATLFELYEKYGIYGDKKMAYKTSVCKKYPTPNYKGEKYYPNRQKYYMIDTEGPCLLLNEPICVVEYLPDGITASRYKRYYENPVGLAAYRKFIMQYNPVYKNIFRQSIHFVAMNLIAKNGIGFKDSDYKVANIVMAPLGILLYLYIKYRNRGEL
ncbi:glycosyltransferase family A protein [Salinicoccus sp. RF5]|uniref:glycosyltransferase family 2 protein n=1 Tax=Salinicoccus sp. RF5 TaxID=2748874 RepID=UPI001E52A8DF|nr:glycosyltransferase family A protein [Salinicoccus sp. RF5]MCC4722356.1 glycosyltransferase family 2 protein [Salinicoccus sp. RF5]